MALPLPLELALPPAPAFTGFPVLMALAESSGLALESVVEDSGTTCRGGGGSECSSFVF